MIRVISAIIEKTKDKMAISGKIRFLSTIETSKYPVPSNRKFNSSSNKIYLWSGFKKAVT